MPLNTRRALDPRWTSHHRSVPEGHMNAVCEVFRRDRGTNQYQYDPVSGELTGGFLCLLYRGGARAIANKDWRARRKNLRGDAGVQHGYRIQLPVTWCPPVHVYDIIRIIDNPADQELTHYIFHVRNLTPSSHSWARNVLCDLDVGHPTLLPPPSTVTPVEPGHLLSSGESCGCGSAPLTLEAP